jgi:hypothetical protein
LTAALKATPRLEMYRRLPEASQYALTETGYGRFKVIRVNPYAIRL